MNNTSTKDPRNVSNPLISSSEIAWPLSVHTELFLPLFPGCSFTLILPKEGKVLFTLHGGISCKVELCEFEMVDLKTSVGVGVCPVVKLLLRMPMSSTAVTVLNLDDSACDHASC